jgi:hypothetical protein
MKYIVEMGLAAMVYVLSFIMIDSDIKKIMGWGQYTDSMEVA